MQLEAMACGEAGRQHATCRRGVSWVNRDERDRARSSRPATRRRSAARSPPRRPTRALRAQRSAPRGRARVADGVHDGADARAAAASLYREVADRCLPPLGRPNMLKRAFDIALSGPGSSRPRRCGSLFAAAIKLEDGGPVFFRAGARRAVGGRPFLALKFRSMRPDAEAADGRGPGDRATIRASRASAASCARPRWTSCRSCWNILRGDMSFVGPARAAARRDRGRTAAAVLVRLEDVPGLRASHHGAARAHRPRADLRAARRRRGGRSSATIGLYVRQTLVAARRAIDSPLVLD